MSRTLQNMERIKLRKQDAMSRLKRVAALNNLIAEFCRDASGTNMTFGEWLRQKNIQGFSNATGLTDLRSYDEALEDAVLDLGDEFDNIEEEYDSYDAQQDELMVFFGGEAYSNASGEKRKARQEARKQRREARKKFRDEKKNLKKLRKSGKISDSQYRAQLNKAKRNKKKTIDEYGGNVFKQIFGAVKRFNPVSVTARSGALLALSVNAFGWATAFAPAVTSDPRFKPSSIQKAKTQWAKFKAAWVKLGGDPAKLEAAIIKGAKKKPFLSQRGSRSGFTGEQYSNIEPATATLIASGIGLLTAIVPKLIDKTDKDPYVEGAAPADFTTDFEQPLPEKNAPVYDEETGDFIDPKTGESINPQTGETEGEWKTYLLYGAIGLAAALLIFQLIKLASRGK